MRLWLVLLTTACAWAQLKEKAIRPEVLRAHVGFLASDALEGRNTPSRGLDAAAEYISARFLELGLKPMGDNGYFQTETWTVSTPNLEGFRLSVRSGERTVNFTRDFVDLEPSAALRMADREARKVTFEEALKLKADLAGGVWIVELPRSFAPDSAKAYRGFLADIATHQPALVILAGPAAPPRRQARDPLVPVVRVREAGPLLELSEPRVTAVISAASQEQTKVRNVIGLLEGRDAKLKETCVMVSAHYDHLGLAGPTAKDRVYNGANDNASGVAGVIEIASALGKQRRPRRSVLFVAFFGEEKGLLGARYYAAHPVVPLAKTVAVLNFEQLGRTDSSEGPNVGMVNMTGFDFSNLKQWLHRAGAKTGVRLVKHEKYSDPFFNASDNAALAQVGVVAHTLSVTYAFPDYHQPGDEIAKIDFANMARVVRMIGSGIALIANDRVPPKWDAANPKTEIYRKAIRP